MPIDPENVFEKISSEYYALTASEKKVADFVLSSQNGTQFMSISELAGFCNVAEATVSRFCRRLGYKGYNTFKLAVANAMVQHKPWNNPLSGEISEEDSLEDVSKKLYSAELEAISQTMALLDLNAVREAADLLHRANRVICMGQGGSMIMACEAQHLFSTVSNKFSAVGDSHLQAMAASVMEPEDVLLYFSYSGSTKSMVDTLNLAMQQKGRTILVTRFLNSPGADYADIILQCGSHENPLQTGSVSARIAQLYLLDVLFSEYSRRDLDGCRAFRKNIADALSEKHL